MNDESAYEVLREEAEKILNMKIADLPEEAALELVRLVHELDATHTELEKLGLQMRQLSMLLEASRKRFHDLYETAPVAFVTLGRDGFIEMANLAARRLLARDGLSLTGRRFLDFVVAEDVRTYYRGLNRMAARNRPSYFEMRVNGASAEPIVVHVQASPKFDDDGRFAFWQLALSNISALKRKEKELEQIHEKLALATRAAELGLWVYDLKSRSSQWNDQLYRLLGLEPRPGSEDQEYFFEFIHPDDRKGVIANLQSVLSMQGDHLAEDFRIVRADGRIRWLASRGQIFRDEEGEVLRIAGINYDITEQKQAEKAVRHAQTQLAQQLAETEKVNEELSQYAYAVSHDLKGPLRAIRNYADFLSEDLAGSISGEQKKYLEGLKISVDQGDALVNDLLSLSRIGRSALEVERVDVPGLVEEIRAGMDLPPEVDIAVHQRWPAMCADRTLLRQILHNLITNGVKFNRSVRKRIEVGCRQLQDSHVELFVRDNGIGIEPEYRKQIFRIFQRLHSPKEYEGTGIGLAIVKKAAVKLGGEVRLESEAGRGSTFFVRLPLEARDRAEIPSNGYEI